MPDEDELQLSVVVRVVGGGAFLRRCLDRLAPQMEGRPIEVIVPYDSTVGDLDHLVRTFPQVTFLDMGEVGTDARPGTRGAAHELYDRRTSSGLRAARGQILAVLEDYGSPDLDWCEQIMAAHRLPSGIIGGAVEHVGTGVLNWAVYFLDFGRFQLPLPEGPADYLTDVNISYKRKVLESVKEVWINRYNEVTVNYALARKGFVLWQRPQVVVRQDRGDLSFPAAIAERLSWGRVFGATRTREVSASSRLLYILLCPVIPAILLVRMAWKVFNVRRHRATFLLSFPQVLVMTLCWSLGELVGYVTGAEAPSSSGQPTPVAPKPETRESP